MGPRVTTTMYINYRYSGLKAGCSPPSGRITSGSCAGPSPRNRAPTSSPQRQHRQSPWLAGPIARPSPHDPARKAAAAAPT
eukprot:6899179-Alexandrium_andersonii.AAC.1